MDTYACKRPHIIYGKTLEEVTKNVFILRMNRDQPDALTHYIHSPRSRSKKYSAIIEIWENVPSFNNKGEK